MTSRRDDSTPLPNADTLPQVESPLGEQLRPLNTALRDVQQQRSNVAETAAGLVSRDAPVAYPSGIKQPTVASSERAYIQKMVPRKAAVIQNAFEASHTLTIIERDVDLEKLSRAEEQELADAAMNVSAPDDSLPPRPNAVTILQFANFNNLNLLNAAAFVATNTDAEHPVPACKDTRIAFLADQSAHTYALRHQHDATKTRSSTCSSAPKTGIEICITWCEIVPAVDKKTYQKRSEFISLNYNDSADGYVQEICAKVVELWSLCEIQPRSRILGTYRTLCTPNAFLDSAMACSRAFQQLVNGKPEVHKSEYVAHDPDFNGKMDFSRIFLKIVPKKLPLNHPEVFHGLLLHQQGCNAEVREFADRVHREELAKDPNCRIFGLREPKSADEERLGLHILQMYAHKITLGTKISLYGAEAVPGKQIDRVQGSMMHVLKKRIVPLDGRILNDCFILTCGQEACDPLVKAVQQPMWLAIERAVKESDVLIRFAHTSRPKGASQERKSGDGDDASSEPVRFEIRPPTGEERRLQTLLGVPLHCPAFRVGDVCEIVQRECGTTHVGKLLMAMSARFGKDASIEKGFEWGAGVLLSHEAKEAELQKKLTEATENAELEIEKLNERLQTLKRKDATEGEGDSTSSNSATTVEDGESKRSKKDDGSTIATKSTPAPPSSPLTPAGMLNLLRSFGVRIADTIELKVPFSKAGAGFLLKRVACSMRVKEDSFNPSWIKKNAVGPNFTTLQSLGYICGNAVGQCDNVGTVVVMWQTTKRGAVSVTFYCVKTDMECREVTAVDVLNMNTTTTAFLHWNEDSKRCSSTAPINA